MNLAVDSSFNLPVDICFCIVDVLASEDDVESLKACSRTCRTFHSLCVKHIFATLNIDRRLVKDRPSALRRFRSLLYRTPNVATYVKKLDLFIGNLEERNPSIPHILEKLSNVKTFSLSFDDSKRPWHTYRMLLKTSLERFIQSSDLTFFRLKAIKGFPIASVFSSSTHLEGLDLDCAVGPSADDANLESLQQKYDAISHLRSFSMGRHCWKAAGQLLGQGCQNLPVFDFSTLSTLSLDLVHSDEQFELTKRLLNTAKQLKVLEIRVNSYSDELLQHFRFVEHMHPSSQKTLQNLKWAYVIQNEDEDPYCGACEELSILASAKCPLQSIELKVIVTTLCTCSTRKEVWGKLNDVATLAKFPFLRQVTIRVVLCPYGSVDRDLVNGLDDVAQSAFETLRRQPSVDFEFLVTDESV
ncbi:hypothetical protein BJ912DRAFT_1046090 [Pholiota molesta]|nr:hypothetical protein BJ912DRAFT_1046090 [Pholiota molesta]